jgi:hypothetical protein
VVGQTRRQGPNEMTKPVNETKAELLRRQKIYKERESDWGRLLRSFDKPKPASDGPQEPRR